MYVCTSRFKLSRHYFLMLTTIIVTRPGKMLSMQANSPIHIVVFSFCVQLCYVATVCIQIWVRKKLKIASNFMSCRQG